MKLLAYNSILILFFLKCIESNIFINDSINIRQKNEIVIDGSKMFTRPILRYFVNGTLNRYSIEVALTYLRKKTCLVFLPITSTINADIKFNLGPYSHSDLGKTQQKPQIITLRSRNLTLSEVFMFTLRSLGMDFEHNRSDREKYVSVNISNVIPQFAEYFNKSLDYRTSLYGTGYDYLSVMHFRERQYSIYPLPTIESKDKLMGKIMGTSMKPSFNDIKLLNSFYCSHKCRKNLKCLHYGYTDPLDCNRCRCLSFFYGRYCEHFGHYTSPYKKGNIIKVSRCTKSFNLRLYNKFNYIFIAKPGKRIYFKSYLKKLARRRCVCDLSEYVEFRYRFDKSVGGVRFCPCSIEIKKVSYDNMLILSTKLKENIKYLDIYFEIRQI